MNKQKRVVLVRLVDPIEIDPKTKKPVAFTPTFKVVKTFNVMEPSVESIMTSSQVENLVQSRYIEVEIKARKE